MHYLLTLGSFLWTNDVSIPVMLPVQFALVAVASLLIDGSFKEISFQDLLKRCSEASDSREKAWAEFQRRYNQHIILCIFRAAKGVNFEDAGAETIHDLCQEVYLKLLKNETKALRDFRGDESIFAAYLNVIASNVLKNRLKSRNYRTHSKMRSLARVRQGDDAEEVKELLSWETEDEMAEFLFRDSIMNILNVHYASKQTDRDLVVFKLNCFEGLSPKEIVERFPCELSPSGIETLVSRMRQLIRDHLKTS